MVWGEPWTPQKVGDRLVSAFVDLRDYPVYSPRLGVLRPMTGAPVSPLELLTLTDVVLGRRSPTRVMLLTWARAMADGQSVREICRSRDGWSTSTLYHRRDRALEALAVVISINPALTIGTPLQDV